MIPATLQFIIAMIASAINERMQRKLDYVQEEVRVLKEVVLATTGSARISFTAGQRRGLALAGKELSPRERRKYCQLVAAATLLAWFRSQGARKYDSSAGPLPKTNSLFASGVFLPGVGQPRRSRRGCAPAPSPGD
jgi:hypothetical protein